MLLFNENSLHFVLLLFFLLVPYACQQTTLELDQDTSTPSYNKIDYEVRVATNHSKNAANPGNTSWKTVDEFLMVELPKESEPLHESLYNSMMIQFLYRNQKELQKMPRDKKLFCIEQFIESEYTDEEFIEAVFILKNAEIITSIDDLAAITGGAQTGSTIGDPEVAQLSYQLIQKFKDICRKEGKSFQQFKEEHANEFNTLSVLMHDRWGAPLYNANQ